MIFNTVIYFPTIFLGFNGHVSSALIVLIPISFVVYVISFYSLEGHHYFFDSKHNISPRVPDGGIFETHSQRYFDLTKLVIALSGGIIAFLINTLASDKHNDFVARLTASSPIIVGFFGISMATLICFLALMTFWYEQYDHSEKHDSYTTWKYATTISLSWAGMLAFVLGIGWLAQNLFS